MNNNSIYKRQNTAANLLLLQAQRSEYSKAKKLSIWSFIISVVLSCICAIILTYLNSELFIASSALLTCCVLFVDNILKYQIDAHSEIAARIQQTFDIGVYGLNLKYGLLKKVDCVSATAEYDVKNIDDNLKNWYSDYSNLPHYEQILCCQLQNVCWDKKLRTKYQFFTIILAVIIIISIIVVLVIRNSSIITTLVVLSWILPIAQYTCSTYKGINDDCSRLNILEEDTKQAIDTIKVKSDDEAEKIVIGIQLLLFEHRKHLIQIPDWFYFLYKNSYQKSFDRLAEFYSNN
jgi:hypothetical protein